MKIFAAIVIVSLLLFLLRYQAAEHLADKAMQTSQAQFARVQQRSAELQLQLAEQQKQMRKEAYDAELVKIFVKAKDTRKCMQMLDTKVINNEVVECNKDHYVDIRRDEVDAFKEAHGIH